MDPTFPARAYLTQRGFDIAELEEVWKVGFGCEPSGYPELVGRIYIPVYYEGRLVGCQGRYVGELTDKDTRWAKYYNLPGFQKSQYLYNLDRARQQAVAILVEGVTDVWKLGPAGVALFGKHASTRQIQLISAFLHQKPFVVLLDGEADQEADRLYQQLKPLALAGLAKVQLPPGRDPGSCTRKELWDIIRAQAQTQGVKLPAPS
jgi:DNA primase